MPLTSTLAPRCSSVISTSWTLGVTSTMTTDRTRSGFDGGEADRRQATERHADDHERLIGQLPDRAGYDVGVAAGPIVAVRAMRRPPVAREIDRDQRASQCQAHTVPRVRVLAAAVQEDQLRGRIAPHEGAQQGAVRLAEVLATYGRGGRAQMRELVVVVPLQGGDATLEGRRKGRRTVRQFRM